MAVASHINTTPDAAALVAASMANALNRTFEVEAFAGRDAQSRLPDSARTADCLGNVDCLVQAARALEADQLLMLVIVRVGDQIKVEATWVDQSSGATALRPTIDVDNLEAGMDQTFLAAAETLLPNATRIAPEEPVEEPSEARAVVPDAAITQPGEPPPPERRGRHMTTLSWVTLGIGGAGLLSATVYGSVVTWPHCGAPWGDGACDAETPNNALAINDVMWGVAGVGLVATGILYLTSGGDDMEESTSVTAGVAADQDSVGMTVGGSF